MKNNEITRSLAAALSLKADRLADLSLEVRLLEHKTSDRLMRLLRSVIGGIIGTVVSIGTIAAKAWALVKEKFDNLPEGAAAVTAFLKAVAEVFGFETMKAGIGLLIGLGALGAIAGIGIVAFAHWYADNENYKLVRKSLYELSELTYVYHVTSRQVKKFGIQVETYEAIERIEKRLQHRARDLTSLDESDRISSMANIKRLTTDTAISDLMAGIDPETLDQITIDDLSDDGMDYELWAYIDGMENWLEYNGRTEKLTEDQKEEALSILNPFGNMDI